MRTILIIVMILFYVCVAVLIGCAFTEHENPEGNDTTRDTLDTAIDKISDMIGEK